MLSYLRNGEGIIYTYVRVEFTLGSLIRFNLESLMDKSYFILHNVECVDYSICDFCVEGMMMYVRVKIFDR